MHGHGEIVGARRRRSGHRHVAEAIGTCSGRIEPRTAGDTADAALTRCPRRTSATFRTWNQQVAVACFVTLPHVPDRLGRILHAKGKVEQAEPEAVGVFETATFQGDLTCDYYGVLLGRNRCSECTGNDGPSCGGLTADRHVTDELARRKCPRT